MEVNFLEDFHVDCFHTYVVGLHHPNEEGQIRIESLMAYLESKVGESVRYGGYRKEDFLSENFYNVEKIYEFNYRENSSISFIEEKENIFDKDPIKVYHKELGDLGYLPLIHKEAAREIIKNHIILSVEFVVTGGKYISLDIEDRSLSQGENTLGIEINIMYI